MLRESTLCPLHLCPTMIGYHDFFRMLAIVAYILLLHHSQVVTADCCEQPFSRMHSPEDPANDTHQVSLVHISRTYRLFVAFADCDMVMTSLGCVFRTRLSKSYVDSESMIFVLPLKTNIVANIYWIDMWYGFLSSWGHWSCVHLHWLRVRR